MRSLIDDLRYGFKTLRNSPGFTVVALLTLALGIGANTAVFSLMYAALLRALPVDHPEQLALVEYATKQHQFGVSIPLVEDMNRKQSVFGGVMMWRTVDVALTRGPEANAIEAGAISGNGFEVLGLKPYLGRAIAPADDQLGGGPNGWVGMLTFAYWQAEFRGDDRVLGQSLQIENRSVMIVGIAPPHFETLQAGATTNVLLPLRFFEKDKPQEGAMMYTVLARLKPGVTLKRASAQLDALSPGIIAENDPHFILRRGFFGGGRLLVSAGRTGRSAAESLRDPLYVLGGLVVIALLICCANVAGLLGSRMAARRHELAVRSALGAKRGRLLRQLLVEALLLCAGGALAAILTMGWAAPLLLRVLIGNPEVGPAVDVIHLNLAPDWHVFGFTFLMAMACALLIAVMPGIRATRVDLARDLSAGTHQQAGGRMPLERAIVAGQVAFASLLLVAAGLFASTVYRLVSTDPGFQTRGVMLVPTDLHRRPERGEKLIALYEQITQRIRAVPSVQAVSVESIPTLSGYIATTHYATELPDGSVREDDGLAFNSVGADYFSTVGTQILGGRDFGESDRDSKHRVCALSRSAAQFFFPQGNAIGSSVRSYEDKKLGEPCEIVAVVGDAKFTSLRAASPHLIYWTFMETPTGDFRQTDLYLVIRTSNPAAAAEAARKALTEVAPGVPPKTPIMMDKQLLVNIATERAMATLGGVFAALALLLTAVGLFGILSFQVNRRTREIAIRMAIGADANEIKMMVVRNGVLLTLAGVGVGLVSAVGLSRLVRSMLYGTQATSPAALVGSAAVLLVVALVASYLPARRATKVDPMLALRTE